VIQKINCYSQFNSACWLSLQFSLHPLLQFAYLSNGVSCFTTSDKNCEWKQSYVKLAFIILEALDGREMLVKGIVLSTAFSFVCGALNRGMRLCSTVHLRASLPLISAEALCMDYWCDMIRVSWCLSQPSFVFWLKYLSGSLNPGNFSCSLSSLGSQMHLLWFDRGLSYVRTVKWQWYQRSETLTLNNAVGSRWCDCILLNCKRSSV